MAHEMRREGPFRERVKVFVLRSVLFNVWRLAERLGIRLATEGPTYAPTDAQREAMDALVVRARAEGGVIDASSIGLPAHELLTHLVVQHRLLLHGSNNTQLEVIEPRPAHDYGTEVEAVVAADDGIWPLFYAVIARDRVDGVFTACMHLGARLIHAASTTSESLERTRTQTRRGYPVPSTPCHDMDSGASGGTNGYGATRSRRRFGCSSSRATSRFAPSYKPTSHVRDHQAVSRRLGHRSGSSSLMGRGMSVRPGNGVATPPTELGGSTRQARRVWATSATAAANCLQRSHPKM